MALKSSILIHGTKATELVIIHDPDKCTGCMQCMIACAYKYYKTFDRRYALLYVYEDPDNPGRFINANCSHCIFPMCLSSCPREAIYKDDLGIVRISPALCIGCGTCNQSCPIGIPRIDEEKNVYVKCDFCDGDPMCVKMCSAQALMLLPRKEALEYLKGRKK
jgi:Fe-S-cluster-containing dehydrogenase component